MELVSLKDNKIIFDKEAVELLKLSAEDRIDIRYWMEGDDIFPVIGKVDVFKDSEGKRVTKKFTVLYRGQQAQILAVYGTDFRLEAMDNGMFKMIPVTLSKEDKIISEVENDLDSINDLSETGEINW